MSWTIQSLLQWTETFFKKQSIPSPRSDAEVLLSTVLGMKRVDLYVSFDRPIHAGELAQFKPLVQRRAKHEPVQYITGCQEFWSLNFKVNESVLIPRPETECVVEQALRIFKDRINEDIRILDMGCGSGVLSVVLAKEFSSARVVAVDISQAALNVAISNAKQHGVYERIDFLESDLFSKMPKDLRFDLIVSNPPYMRSDQMKTLERQVREYEPREALEAGELGLDVHFNILKSAPFFLQKKGALIMEIAPDQGQPLNDHLTKQKIFSNMEVIKDYERRERIIVIQYG